MVNMFIENEMSARLSIAFKKFQSEPGAAKVNNLVGAKMEKRQSTN